MLLKKLAVAALLFAGLGFAGVGAFVLGSGRADPVVSEQPKPGQRQPIEWIATTAGTHRQSRVQAGGCLVGDEASREQPGVADALARNPTCPIEVLRPVVRYLSVSAVQELFEDLDR